MVLTLNTLTWEPQSVAINSIQWALSTWETYVYISRAIFLSLTHTCTPPSHPQQFWFKNIYISVWSILAKKWNFNSVWSRRLLISGAFVQLIWIRHLSWGAQPWCKQSLFSSQLPASSGHKPVGTSNPVLSRDVHYGTSPPPPLSRGLLWPSPRQAPTGVDWRVARRQGGFFTNHKDRAQETKAGGLRSDINLILEAFVSLFPLWVRLDPSRCIHQDFSFSLFFI